MQSKFPVFSSVADRYKCASVISCFEDKLVRKFITAVNKTSVFEFAAQRFSFLNQDLGTFIGKYEGLKKIISKSKYSSSNNLKICDKYLTSVDAVMKSVGVFVNYLKSAIENCELECKDDFKNGFNEYTSSCHESNLFRPSLDAFFIMLQAHEGVK